MDAGFVPEKDIISKRVRVMLEYKKTPRLIRRLSERLGVYPMSGSKEGVGGVKIVDVTNGQAGYFLQI